MTKEDSEEELFNQLKYTVAERQLIRLGKMLEELREKHGRAQKDDKGGGSGRDSSSTPEDQD